MNGTHYLIGFGIRDDRPIIIQYPSENIQSDYPKESVFINEQTFKKFRSYKKAAKENTLGQETASCS